MSGFGQLHRGERAAIRVGEKLIATRRAPGRVISSCVKAPAGATQPEPAVTAQYGL
ncbi:MAG: hypothetical protein JOY56_10530 [Solirubrobacterales bacterium]|nr:hypothetical protein [Solirubrobacterales bacterium]